MDQTGKRDNVALKLGKPEMGIMKTPHFVHSFGQGLMLNHNAISRNHGSRAVGAALTVNENLSVGVVPDQIEELHDLPVGRIVFAVPGNIDVLHSQGLDFSFLNSCFLNVVPKIDDDSHAEMLKSAKAR